MRRLRSIARGDGEDGFGLIETVVALLIAGIVFGALATTLISAVQASLFGRQNQQATDFMTREVENWRTMDFAALANRTADIVGDTRLVGCGALRCLDVNGADAGGLEPVVTQTAGGVSPHTRDLVSGVVVGGVVQNETNNTTFTTSTYVTEMPDQPVAQARRVTVYISWVSKGETHTRSTSTIVAFTQRGLPLPVFKLELPVTTLSVNPGANVDFDVTLTNQGAPDRWDITLSGSTSGFQLFADTDASGDLSAGDSLMTDTTGNGVIDTGRIDPSTTFRFFLHRTSAPSEALGTKTTTITATSSGQPAAAGGVKSVDATTMVTTGAVTPPPGPTPTVPPSAPPPPPTCPASATPTFSGMNNQYTQRMMSLHNDGVGATAAQVQMSMNGSAGDEPFLPAYSTDIDAAVPGRILQPAAASMVPTSTALALTDPAKFADWSMTAGKNGSIDGTGILRLWVAPRVAAGPVQMKVMLYKAATASGTKALLTETTVSVPMTCAGFQEVYVQLPDYDGAVSKNQLVGVRLVTDGATDVVLGYDVLSVAPGTFSIGVKGWTP